MLRKLLAVAVLCASVLFMSSPGGEVHAEPSDPSLPRITGAPVTLWKDTNADGVYDTRVYPQSGGPGTPDTYSDLDGLWDIAVPAEDLYVVIEVDVETRPSLIAGDVADGIPGHPNAVKINGLPVTYYLESNFTTIFGDYNPDPDTVLDSDVTTCDYRSNFCGDYRVWDQKNGGSRAIVIHVDNTTAGYTHLHGWLWEQIPPDKDPIW